MSHAESLARIRASGGPELAERLTHLDHAWRKVPRRAEIVAKPSASDRIDVDVVIAGGGLWSILAPLLAARGLRVKIFDRARVGVAHREWNAARDELEALVRVGLVTERELESLVVAAYDHGVCRFAGGRDYRVRGVLDHAVNAGGLLSLARRRAESAGVEIHDGVSIVGHAAGLDRIRVRTEDAASGASGELVARVLIDARGASSALSRPDLVCPTVGGVVRGIESGDGPRQMNPRVGEILATIDPVRDGRQEVWEAFPGANGETTVYVFFYARADERVSLVDLYGTFFDRMGVYKAGELELVRPTFGFIPGWSRLAPLPKPTTDRIVLVGDAAARHSPLTYCGFGATLRSLERAVEAVLARMDRQVDPDASDVDDAPVHALTGALAHLLASRAFRGGEVNSLLDAAFSSLFDMGEPAYRALLRDEMNTGDFVTFLRTTSKKHPAVWRKVWRGMGARDAIGWAGALAGRWLTSRAA